MNSSEPSKADRSLAIILGLILLGFSRALRQGGKALDSTVVDPEVRVEASTTRSYVERDSPPSVGA